MKGSREEEEGERRRESSPTIASFLPSLPQSFLSLPLSLLSRLLALLYLLQRLASFEAIPDYAGYLVYVLTQVTQEDERSRAVAGLILKNNVHTLVDCSPPVISYVKDSVLNALGDANAMVRTTVTIVIDSLLMAHGVSSWPEAMGKLVQSMDSQNEAELDVSRLFYFSMER